MNQKIIQRPTPAKPSRLGFSLVLPMLLFIGALSAAAWWVSEAQVLRQTVSEGRTVADMVENIGRWASQYGGVHVRTIGSNAKIPGNFLTRSVYAVSGADGQVLAGAKVEAAAAERDALERVEAYHWKNPALIQREVADVITASGSKARYRLTARTVLNKNNAPDRFETEALDAIQAAADSKADADQRPGVLARERQPPAVRPLGGRASELPALPRQAGQRAGVHPHQRPVQRRRRLWLRRRQAGRPDQRVGAADQQQQLRAEPATRGVGRHRRGRRSPRCGC